MQDLPILTSEEMRNQYFPSLSIAAYNDQNQYHEILCSKGLQLNSKIYPSTFLLKNDLPYVGMAIKEKVQPHQVLIRIPQELVLSSAKAILQPQLQQVFQDPFFINELWQDRVIIVYCLWLLHEKDEGNIWYQMIKLFPKECDILCFWKEEQIEQLKDETIRFAAVKDLQSYTEEWQGFLSLQSKHEILQFQEYNEQNYKNVFINLNNRSFGKNINYISLVPMAELFNHHCSKVHYTIENIKNHTFFTNEDDSSESSVGSYESNEYIQEGQYSYDEVKITPYNWNAEDSYKLVKKEKIKLQAQTKRILQLIENEVNWQDFTILVVGNFIQKLKIIQKEYLVGRKPYYDALNDIMAVQRSLKRYKKEMIKYYKETKKREYMKKLAVKIQENKAFQYPVYKKQYESIIIQTGKEDTIEPNNQIYFKYGNNSNRSLLLRYGFAIEGNKYEHVWISFNIIQRLKEFPDVLEKLIDKRISLYRKFKLHHHILNMDLIVFFRLQKWMFFNEEDISNIFKIVNIPKEIIILQQIISVLEQKILKYSGNYDLTDKSMGYHQYFIAVYHLEKYKIFRKQIGMLRTIIIALAKIDNGSNKNQALSTLSKSQIKILDHYFKNIDNE